MRRAVALVLVGVVIAVTCTFLGRWQWHRHVARSAAVALVDRNYDAEPVALGDLLARPDQPLDPSYQWRPVTVRGRYAAASTVLLRNRPVDGSPAYHVLVPLVVAGTAGRPTVLVVDRGWVPVGPDGRTPARIADPPSGQVTVTARLRLPEAPSGRPAPAGQVQALSPDDVLAAAGLDAGTYRAYATLVAEQPPADQRLGALPAPDRDLGPHLSYAFQWWTFALGGLLGFGWLARREIVDPAGPGPSPGRPSARTRGRGLSDEEVEDAIVDGRR